MDVNMILMAVLIVSGIGLVFGIILAVASVLMAVPTDDKVDALNEALPGANCGACGYSGCEGYAKALSEGTAKLGVCAPGGEETAKVLAEILGVEAGAVEKKVAVVRCMGSCDNTDTKMNYQGLSSCAAAVTLHGGTGACSFGCMGLGDCVNACAYNAVSVCNGVAQIDAGLCKGCSLCVTACPKNIITLVPKKAQAVVRCSNSDKGAVARKVCKTACIGCKRCEKACEAVAISVVDFKASVDPEKCTDCRACIEVCTQGCITDFCF